MVKVADTLNYINQSTKSLHSSGYNYTVFMDDFFSYDTSTGLVEHGPPTNRKRTATATQSVPAEEAPQTPEEQTATVFQATHQPIKQDKYNYDCYNVDINLLVYNTFTKAAQAPPKNTCHCGINFPQATELEQHNSLVHKTKDTVALSVGSPTGTIGGLGNISGFSTFKFIPICVKWLDAN